MRTRTLLIGLTVAATLGSFAPLGAQSGDWQIPADARELRSPMAQPLPPDAVKKGKDLFGKNCQKCHGADGTGHGPYSDPAHPAANLTSLSLEDNPDGVVFYKVWNGKKPMPAFKSLLTKDEVWAVVEYIRTLRQP